MKGSPCILASTQVTKFIFILSIFVLTAECAFSSCSRTCTARSCDSMGIRYGRYCGVGHTGCPGEAPCDDVDACCKLHDECVGINGVTSVTCHKKFKNCIGRALRSGKVGFSQTCPYGIVVPTMSKAMDTSILLSSSFGFLKRVFRP